MATALACRCADIAGNPGNYRETRARPTESRETPADPPVLEVAHPGYQPGKAELEEDLRVDATLEEAVQALAQPVKLRYVKYPKRKR